MLVNYPTTLVRGFREKEFLMKFILGLVVGIPIGILILYCIVSYLQYKIFSQYFDHWWW